MENITLAQTESGHRRPSFALLVNRASVSVMGSAARGWGGAGAGRWSRDTRPSHGLRVQDVCAYLGEEGTRVFGKAMDPDVCSSPSQAQIEGGSGSRPCLSLPRALPRPPPLPLSPAPTPPHRGSPKSRWMKGLGLS